MIPRFSVVADKRGLLVLKPVCSGEFARVNDLLADDAIERVMAVGGCTRETAQRFALALIGAGGFHPEET